MTFFCLLGRTWTDPSEVTYVSISVTTSYMLGKNSERFMNSPFSADLTSLSDTAPPRGSVTGVVSLSGTVTKFIAPTARFEGMAVVVGGWCGCVRPLKVSGFDLISVVF